MFGAKRYLLAWPVLTATLCCSASGTSAPSNTHSCVVATPSVLVNAGDTLRMKFTVPASSTADPKTEFILGVRTSAPPRQAGWGPEAHRADLWLRTPLHSGKRGGALKRTGKLSGYEPRHHPAKRRGEPAAGAPTVK